MEIVLVIGVVAFFMWRSKRRRGELGPVAELGAVGWTAGIDWRVLRPLARFESWRLLRHPAFIAGVVITPLMLFAATENESEWWRVSASMALALVPLGWLTIIASNLLALQPRRTGADELLAAAPSGQPVRTTGQLLSAVSASAVAAVLAALWLVARSTVETGGSPQLLEIAAGVVLVAGSVAVGVGTARWIPYVGVGVLAALAVSVIQARFADVSTWPWNLGEAHPGRFLGFLAAPTSVGAAALEIRPAAWHLVYLAGLVLLMAVVALARDGLPRSLAAVLAVAVVAIVGSGWVQTRAPSDARVAAIVDFITNPRDHQTCTQAGLTSYCAYPEQRDRVGGWMRRVESVRALLPEPIASRRLAVDDRVPTLVGSSSCGSEPFLDSLHPAAAGKVTPESVWPDDGAIHPGPDAFPCGGRSVHELFTAVQVGSWSVGLPSSPHGLDIRCDATGQARAVLALWLGAVVTPEGERTLRELASEHPGGMVTFETWDAAPMLGVHFAVADVELAVALLDVPTKSVAATIADKWTELTNPTIASSVLAELFDVEARGADQLIDAALCA